MEWENFMLLGMMIYYFAIKFDSWLIIFGWKMGGESLFWKFGYFRGVFCSKALPRLGNKIFDK